MSIAKAERGTLHLGQDKTDPVAVARAVSDWRAKMSSALTKSLTPERLDRVIEGLVKRAEGGDVGAAKLLLAYAVGSVPAEQTVKYQLDPGPNKPCPSRPGTEGKIATLEGRAQKGLPLHQSRDRRFADED